MTLVEGETYTYERTFTVEDVRRFAAVTGDDQPRHTDPDEDGHLVVQGLLTGSLLTKIGGDHEVLASRIDLHFTRPVYTDDAVRCEWTNESVQQRPQGQKVTASVECLRENETVLEATVEGVV